MNNKPIIFKFTQVQLEAIRQDLKRPHPFAAERVGFAFCRFGRAVKGQLLILALCYLPIPDEDYIKDYRFGALLGPNGFSKAFSYAYKNEVGIFHVHLHDHFGAPGFSNTDRREMAKYVPDFFNVRPTLAHGALVISENGLSGRCWKKQKSRGVPITDFWVIGAPMKQSKGKA